MGGRWKKGGGKGGTYLVFDLRDELPLREDFSLRGELSEGRTF